MGWYASSTGEIREADGYPAPAFWAQMPDPDWVPDPGGGMIAPEEWDRMIVAVPCPLGVVGVPVRLIGGRWQRIGEISPIGAFYKRALDEGEEVVNQWHSHGRPTRQDVIKP